MTIRYYWDSCVFIDRLQRTPERIAMLEAITDLAADGKALLITSTMGIAEMCRVNDDESESQEQLIRDYFDNDYIVVRQLDRRTAEEAAHICRQSGLKPPDAIHVATALASDVSVLHTYDERLLKKDGQIGNPPLKIARPYVQWQLPLLKDDHDETAEGGIRSKRHLHPFAPTYLLPPTRAGAWRTRTPGLLLPSRSLTGDS